MLRALGFAFQALALGDFPLQGGRLAVELRETRALSPATAPG